MHLDYAAPMTVQRFKETNTVAYKKAAALGQTVRVALTNYQLRQLPLSIRRYFDEETVMKEMRNRF